MARKLTHHLTGTPENASKQPTIKTAEETSDGVPAVYMIEHASTADFIDTKTRVEFSRKAGYAELGINYVTDESLLAIEIDRLEHRWADERHNELAEASLHVKRALLCMQRLEARLSKANVANDELQNRLERVGFGPTKAHPLEDVVDQGVLP